MTNSNGLDWFIDALLIIGGINWGMIGLFDINFVSTLFGEMTMLARTVYVLVGLSALYIALRVLLSETVATNTGRVIHQKV